MTDNFADTLVKDILEPGVRPAVLGFLDYVFAALILLIMIVVYMSPDSIHVWIYLGLAIGLVASFKWFMNELAKADASGTTDGTGSAPTGAMTKKDD